MPKILLEETDYYRNTVPRLPICICIDASSRIERSSFPDINKFLEKFIKYVDGNAECKIRVQLCIVAFGERAEVVSDFAAVDGTVFVAESLGGEPDLDGALRKCVQLLNARLRDYVEAGISYYLPELLLLSSGETSTDISETAQRLRSAQIQKKISVTPFKINKNSADILKQLSLDGIVYTPSNDFTKVFECLKSGLEMLSASSAAAGKTLKEQAVGWDKLVEKGE